VTQPQAEIKRSTSTSAGPAEVSAPDVQSPRLQSEENAVVREQRPMTDAEPVSTRSDTPLHESSTPSESRPAVIPDISPATTPVTNTADHTTYTSPKAGDKGNENNAAPYHQVPGTPDSNTRLTQVETSKPVTTSRHKPASIPEQKSNPAPVPAFVQIETKTSNDDSNNNNQEISEKNRPVFTNHQTD
jgi:hypothetical protein